MPERAGGRRAASEAADVVRIAAAGLWKRRLRTALAALGVVIAVATVVLVAGVPASSQAALDARLRALGTDLLRVDPFSADAPVLLPRRTIGMLDRIGPVREAATVANVHAEVRRTALEPQADSSLVVLAAGGPLRRVLRARLADGRWMPDGPLPTAVLGSDAAVQLGLARLPARAVVVDLGGVRFQVVGILRPTPLSVDVQSAVLVSGAAAARWLHWDGRPTVAWATVDEAAIDAVRPVMAATLSPESAGLVQVSRPSDVLLAKRVANDAFQGLVLGLAGVALLVGGVGVANTMFVSVLERRREIGLRRALGARRGQIRAQFLTEAVLLCGVGGAGGALLGVVGCALWAALRGWPPVVPAGVVALGVAASLVTGVLAGLVPSVRAARLSPVAALAAE